VSRLRHGYTNRTRRLTAGVVEKRYDGADAGDRSRREYRCLTSLSERLPVPQVIGWDASVPVLTLVEMPGTHGQDMIETGRGREVLRLLGSLLRELQEIDPASVPGLRGRGDVIVHGDFGPQNVLIEDGRISALLDWEFTHVGCSIEDLAWASGSCACTTLATRTTCRSSSRLQGWPRGGGVATQQWSPDAANCSAPPSTPARPTASHCGTGDFASPRDGQSDTYRRLSGTPAGQVHRVQR
jgi:aminoglycoside phosphotransferase (APT) family kinase protein